MGSGRVNGSGVDAVFLFAQFNGDTGASNYQFQNLVGTNTTPAAAQDLTFYGAPLCYFIADTGTVNFSGKFVAFIPHYNSNYYKSILTFDGIHVTTAASVAVWDGTWKNTAKIQSIRVFPDTAYASAKIEAGTLLSIYGIQ
jgi:hypothetical protein